jgi:plasmid stabilization system protein ParE
MTYKIAITRRAEQDRATAFDWYCANYSREFAVRWYNGITRAIRSLSKNPLRCSTAAESDRFPFDLRQLLYGKRRNKHRVLFTLHDDVVLVLHIRHSAQRDLTADDL